MRHGRFIVRAVVKYSLRRAQDDRAGWTQTNGMPRSAASCPSTRQRCPGGSQDTVTPAQPLAVTAILKWRAVTVARDHACDTRPTWICRIDQQLYHAIRTVLSCVVHPVMSQLVREDGSMESRDRRASGTSEAVVLREVTDNNRPLVEDLRVAPDQEGFVDSVRQSLVEAAATPHAKPWYRAVYLSETPVGFVMLGDDVPPGNPHIPWRYYLWRMLIDARYQGRGYGRAALDLVVAYVKTRPGADFLVTSVVAGEGSPLGFYQRYGFELNGEMFDHEHVMQLQLKEIR